MATTKAISSYQAYLLRGTTSGGTTTFAKVCNIKDFPDLGGAPEQLETTTLADNTQTYILGIQSLDALEFTANYTSESFDAIKGFNETDLTTPSTYAVVFGATEASGKTTYGANGNFQFTGQIDVYVNGAGVNEVVEMTLSIAPQTPIEKKTGTIEI